MNNSLLNPEQMVLNTIINNIPAMVFYKNLDGVYIAANEMFCNQLRTTPREIIGKTDFDFYQTGRARRYQETDRKVIQAGKPTEPFEEEIMVKGELKIFTTRKVLVTDSEGKPYGIIGLAYDVTESRRTEKELVESRSRYKSMYNMLRLMTDNMPDMLWAKDLNRKYIFANKAVCEKLLNARDTDEPIGKTDLFFAQRECQSHPENAEWHTFGKICQDSDDLTMQQKKAGCYIEQGNVKGEFLHLDVRKAPILDEEGKMIGTVGSGRDITKQKLMEQEFHALYQRNRAIIEALPDLMFLFDDQAKFLECYISNTRELAVQVSEIIGCYVDDFFEPSISLKTREMIHLCIQTKSIQTFDYEMIREGKRFYYEARLVHVEGNKVLCISRNITERKNLQSELVLQKERAEESSRLKSSLLNNMSHELRTPLNGILGFSEILANELNDNEFIDMARYINKSGKRLMKTLESVMQLSQLESGIKVVHPVPVDIYKNLENLINTFNSSAHEKGLVLELRGKPLQKGYIDPYFLVHAVSDILENAVKFTRKGRVTLEMEACQREDARWLTIRISDTGIGIAEDKLKLIFEEFRQASEGQNRSFEGTGLGLTIAKKMIRLLGGEISVESRLGEGSSFIISIPFPEETAKHDLRQKEKNSNSTETTLPVKPPKEKPLLLLVEDNEVNFRLTLTYLKDHYELDWAQDGLVALQKIKEKQYTVILMDINLGPGMDGVEVIREIRQIREYRDTPIIALTGYTLFGDRERLLESGCDAYLPKPYTRSDIHLVLKETLQGHSERPISPSKPE